MTQIIPHSELLQRALTYVNEKLNEDANRLKNSPHTLMDILDQAGMRFNLTPLDMETLHRIFTKDMPEN